MLLQHLLSLPVQVPPRPLYTTHPGSPLSHTDFFKLQFDSDKQPGWRIFLRVLGFVFFILSIPSYK